MTTYLIAKGLELMAAAQIGTADPQLDDLKELSKAYVALRRTMRNVEVQTQNKFTEKGIRFVPLQNKDNPETIYEIEKSKYYGKAVMQRFMSEEKARRTEVVFQDTTQNKTYHILIQEIAPEKDQNPTLGNTTVRVYSGILTANEIYKNEKKGLELELRDNKYPLGINWTNKDSLDTHLEDQIIVSDTVEYTNINRPEITRLKEFNTIYKQILQDAASAVKTRGKEDRINIEKNYKQLKSDSLNKSTHKNKHYNKRFTRIE